VVVAANGHVGGLYAFPVYRSGSSPIIGVAQASFFRRGNSGLSWDTLYATAGDSVGEPETKDILYVLIIKYVGFLRREFESQRRQ
jgi:hypothetical protein